MGAKNEAAKPSTKLAEKSNNNASHKHSGPFYISTSLFHNKRLKRKLCKWAVALKNAGRRKVKTDICRQKLTTVQADITIDLLSDDEDTPKYKHPFQDLVMYPELSQLMPQISLVSKKKSDLQDQDRHNKRTRKSRQPKRHSQPTIVNSESIVLTDDSDAEIPPIEVMRASTPNKQTPEAATFPHSADVDEEVTVSIVPRNSTAGHCSKVNGTEVFPMLPDETTVHTVIANRIYELSLTKLREGLASCGIPEFVNGQEKVSPTRRVTTAKAPVATPPPAPISLKLSSDLSISLISDEEDEQLQVSPEKLLQQQPHLSVQQLEIPATVATNGHQVPRRRKLG